MLFRESQHVVNFICKREPLKHHVCSLVLAFCYFAMSCLRLNDEKRRALLFFGRGRCDGNLSEPCDICHCQHERTYLFLFLSLVETICFSSHLFVCVCGVKRERKREKERERERETERRASNNKNKTANNFCGY